MTIIITALNVHPYAKAGFKKIDRRMTISGEAVLMARDALPSELLVPH